MGKKGISLLITLLVVVSLLIGCFGCAAPAPPKEVKLSVVTFVPGATDRVKILLGLFDRITEESGGMLTFEYVGGPEAIPGADQGLAVKNGVVDISMLPGAFYQGIVPEASLLSLTEIDTADMRGSKAQELLIEVHEKGGLFFMGREPAIEQPEFIMSLKDKRVEKPSDLKGLLLGASSLHIEAGAEALGMELSVIPLPEAYTALERGVIEGYSTTERVTFTSGAYEGVKYIIDHPYFKTPTAIIVNLDKWNSLSADYQNLIMDNYWEYLPELISANQEANKQYREKILAAGVEYIKFSDADAKLFLDTIYGAERQRAAEEYPEYGSAIVEALAK